MPEAEEGGLGTVGFDAAISKWRGCSGGNTGKLFDACNCDLSERDNAE